MNEYSLAKVQLNNYSIADTLTTLLRKLRHF